MKKSFIGKLKITRCGFSRFVGELFFVSLTSLKINIYDH